MYDHLPDKILSLFQHWKKVEININTYINNKRKYDAPIWPLKIYWVRTERVKYISKSLNIEISGIQTGDWDLHKNPIEENVVFKSFHHHFVNNVEWENTKYYNNIKEKTNDGVSEWKGCENMNEVHERLAAYDELYKVIKSDGFKSQAELRNQGLLNDKLIKLQHHPPELEDIAMNLSRDGEYMIANGVHRVSIAKILNIDEIPIRVRGRHEIWQQKRDDIWSDKEDLKSAHEHPDLRPLL